MEEAVVMTTKTWRDKARLVASYAWEEGRATGLEGAALRKYISSRYPFGSRENHPYKIWLGVVKKIMKYGMTPPPSEWGRPRPADLPGQQKLFEVKP